MKHEQKLAAIILLSAGIGAVVIGVPLKSKLKEVETDLKTQALVLDFYKRRFKAATEEMTIQQLTRQLKKLDTEERFTNITKDMF